MRRASALPYTTKLPPLLLRDAPEDDADVHRARRARGVLGRVVPGETHPFELGQEDVPQAPGREPGEVLHHEDEDAGARLGVRLLVDLEFLQDVARALDLGIELRRLVAAHVTHVAIV